jgi:hypothetical protein
VRWPFGRTQPPLQMEEEDVDVAMENVAVLDGMLKD